MKKGKCNITEDWPSNRVVLGKVWLETKCTVMAELMMGVLV